MSGARAYTPRGRTVREAPELRHGIDDGRTNRVRPALQVLDGGRTGSAPARAGKPRASDGQRGTGGVRSGRVVAGGATPASSAGRRGPRARPAALPSRGRRRPRPRRPPKLADHRRRLRVSTILALSLFAVIGIRLVAFQVVAAPAYADAGLQDRLSSPIVLPAPRGAIYDRSGAALAHSVEARYVFADPELVADPPAAADALSPLLGIARSELLPLLSPRKRPDGQLSRFEWLARGVDVDVAGRIVALNLAGIGVGRDERREVPGGDLAANLIGFTGTDMGGLEGLEARYDEILRGVNGQRVVEIGKGDLATEIPGGFRQETPPKPGSSLQLTLDRDLQYEVQRMLSTTVRQHKGSTAAAVVLDVRTGEVLAQASHPTYDAADWQKSKATDRGDVATSFVVDPGSVHKALVFAAALEEGVVRPDSTVVVAPTIQKGDTTIPDTHPMPAGTRMTLPGILAYSSNVGTIKIADALGAQRLYDYQLRFGLGKATGEGMPGEAEGRVLDPRDWSGSSYGSVPIGHSVDVTPL
ncbi:MAG TPA: penicillin-binding protein 2, partial [Micromonosporaceae bacterium]|nr:penicillin-binding protein 2 [Micromonosporaceae bacterium]